MPLLDTDLEPRGFYPEIEPWENGMLTVSGGHDIYWEQSGNPAGAPVVFVHGGPGGGTSPWHRRFFDPARYRIVLFDQRGCGRSTPHASLRANTTWDLVRDMEALRERLRIERWHVFGGSWGSTLGLAYAQKHPDRVRSLVLRGIFLLRKKELHWFYQDGASWLFPDAWQRYLDAIAPQEHGDLMAAYARRLTHPDREVQIAAARAWSTWEGATSRLYVDPKMLDHYGEDEFALAFARIENHYFTHGAWFDHDDQLLNDVPKVRHIPCLIVQGRYDVVCPLRSAWDLHQAWPESKLVIVPDAGHSALEPGTVEALIDGTDGFAHLP
ncbi:MAG: prolyl aminopeptidase [Deltaproteobacteria bacterium]|nr:prolyl aminopeptidase [Deltaproteobacteria bacterium]